MKKLILILLLCTSVYAQTSEPFALIVHESKSAGLTVRIDEYGAVDFHSPRGKNFRTRTEAAGANLFLIGFFDTEGYTIDLGIISARPMDILTVRIAYDDNELSFDSGGFHEQKSPAERVLWRILTEEMRDVFKADFVLISINGNDYIPIPQEDIKRMNRELEGLERAAAIWMEI